METKDKRAAMEAEAPAEAFHQAVLEAAEQGSAEAQFLLGAMYEFGEDGMPQDLKLAVKWYEKSANKHHPQAKQALKECAMTLGMYTLKAGDIPGAVVYFSTAAVMGDDIASVMTGDLVLRHGKGHVPDPVRSAWIWYELAAKQGNADALLRLGDLYRRGVGVPVDLEKAEALIRSAVERGSDQAEDYLREHF